MLGRMDDEARDVLGKRYEVTMIDRSQVMEGAEDKT